MFKAILLFIKTHAIATTITTVVVVGGVTSAVVIPPIVEEYKLTKNVEANLNMLVSSDYQAPNEETITDNNEVNNEIVEENKQEADKSIPLTFRIERVEEKGENWESVSYVIVPSYDKDFSQWSKEEKEAYLVIEEEANKLLKAESEKIENEEKQAIANAELEVQKIINSWSKDYICGSGVVRYNSYTKKYTGSYNTITTTSTTDSYGAVMIETNYTPNEFHEISVEDFRNNIYPKILQNLEEHYKDTPEYSQYKTDLNELYHLSD